MFLFSSLYFHRTSLRRVDVVSLERCACWETKKNDFTEYIWWWIGRDEIQLLFSWPENWIVDKLLNALKRDFITIKLFPRRWCLFLSMHIAHINAKRSFSYCTKVTHIAFFLISAQRQSIVPLKWMVEEITRFVFVFLDRSYQNSFFLHCLFRNFLFNRKHIEKFKQKKS